MRVGPLSILLPGESALVDIDKHVLDAKMSFKKMRARGCFESLPTQMLVYRITDSNRSCTGIILGVDTSEFINDTIVHHELTIPHKVVKQSEVAKEQGGFSKPILLTNRPIPAVTKIINRHTQEAPIIDTYLEKYSAQHQIWPITKESDLQTIIDAFSEKEKAYIVDGHHRTRAIEQLHSDPSVPLRIGLCGMFDIEQLDILPFHRIVDLDMPTGTLLERLEQLGNLEQLGAARQPTQPHEIIIMLDGKYYSFIWNEEATSLVEQLDVNFLSQKVLRDILDIDNESTSPRVKYIEGNQNLADVESKIVGNNKVAFILQAISTDSFIDILNEGLVLPPKSTFFLPRMANGIISMAWR